MIVGKHSLLQHIEVLSLDICVGVLGSGAIAQTWMHAQLKSAWWWILPLCVWAIYTADHLADAHKLGAGAVNIRHRYHHRHFSRLLVCASLAAAVAFAGAIIYLRELVVMGGILVGILAVTHILLAYWGRWRFGKEISVALVYTAGVWFAPVANRRVPLSPVVLLGVAAFFIAALQNLLMNAVIEHETDHAEGELYAAAVVPQRVLTAVIYAVAVVAALCAAVYWAYARGHTALSPREEAAAGLVLLLVAIPAAILWLQRFAFMRRHYRVFAEWSFAAGLILLVIP